MFWSLLKLSPKSAFDFIKGDYNPIHGDEVNDKTGFMPRNEIEDKVKKWQNEYRGKLQSMDILKAPNTTGGSGTTSSLAVEIKQDGRVVGRESFNLGDSAHRSIIVRNT